MGGPSQVGFQLLAEQFVMAARQRQPAAGSGPDPFGLQNDARIVGSLQLETDHPFSVLPFVRFSGRIGGVQREASAEVGVPGRVVQLADPQIDPPSQFQAVFVRPGN